MQVALQVAHRGLKPAGASSAEDEDRSLHGHQLPRRHILPYTFDSSFWSLALAETGEHGAAATYGVSRSCRRQADKALKKMHGEIRRRNVQTRTDKAFDDLALMFNPHIRGWINYYSQFPTSRRWTTACGARLTST